MPTPRGKGLAGKADGREEGWEGRLMDRVNASEAERLVRRGKKRDVQLRTEWDIEMQALLRLAAEKRGITPTGYARRAIAAFVASDLDLPFEEVCGFFAYPMPPGKVMTDEGVRLKKGRTKDDGQGFGDWRV